MLRWTLAVGVAVTLCAAGLGCNDRVVPQGDLPSAPKLAAKEAEEPILPAKKQSFVPDPREFETPQAAVDGFLGALRAGDQLQVKHMLTAKAQAEAAAKGKQVRPMGSPTATYVVGEVREVRDEKGQPGAHVHSTWTDEDADGKKVSFEVAWILRREEGQWRIMGMAAQIPGTREPAMLNYEDLDALERTRMAAEAQLAEQPGTMR